MSNMKICPLCKKENSDNSTICSNCGFDLNPTFASEEGIPDWLSAFRENSENDSQSSPLNTPKDSQETAENEGEPDWLSRIRERKNTDEEFDEFDKEYLDAPTSPIISNGTDELIGSLRKPATHEVEYPTEEIISDLRKFQDDPAMENSPEKFEITGEAEPTDQEPAKIDEDWISRLTQTAAFESSSFIDEDMGKPAEKKLPSWLPQINPEEDESHLEPLSGKQEFPNWIAKFGESAEDSAESSSASSESQVPDWVQQNAPPETNAPEPKREEKDLNQFPFLKDILNTSIESNGSQDTEAIIPDWISEPDLTEVSAENQGNEQSEQASAYFQEFEGLGKGPAADVTPFLPDDLGEGTNGQQEPLTEAEQLAADNENYELTSPAIPPFQIDQIPGWLSENEDLVSTNFFDDVIAENEKTSDSAKEIEPGELPSWLKAMRPLEALVPLVPKTKESRKIERSGPLAGLQGVLSSHLQSDIPIPPPAQSLTIDISEKQRKQIDVLNQLFNVEVKAPEQAKRKSNIADRVIKILIPLALFACIVYAIYFLPPQASKPSIYPAETVRFASIVNGLILNQPSSPRILMIMESDGSSLAEIKILTGALLERLMIKNSYISLISTNPTGTLLASNLIRNSTSSSPDYNFSDNVTNFGYLSGAQSGINSFIQSPMDTIYYGSDNQVIWEKPGLSGLSSFSQFDAVLLVTDDTDISKTWIEQIHLLEPEMTLLVASTTQALPLLRPYLDSNQIDGLIGGLYGSYSYTNLIQGDETQIENYWRIQQAGIWFFIFVIVLGGAWQLAIKLSQRVTNKRQRDK
jgi:hypothetical protein